MNAAILNTEVQVYIQEHLNDDAAQVALRKSPFGDVSSGELAGQIESKQRCEKKLPSWFNAAGIYYPQKLAVEQSSSEITAAYKSSLIRGKAVADLTGGLGADSFYFSKIADRVVHCEINKELSDIAQYNAGVLEADNSTYVNADGMSYIRNTEQHFDTIFADPSRRVKSQKVFFLKDCEPDITANLDLLLSKAERVIVKTSPLLDISSGLKELKNVSQIHVISVKNEMKELLWVMDRGFTGEPEITCAALSEKDDQSFRFYREQEKITAIINFSAPLQYLYEPDASLLKGGCFKLIASGYDILKLDTNTHLYTSAQLIHNFIGRIFRVQQCTDYKTFARNVPVKKANVISRNFPLSPEELKKKHKISDGGDQYLLFTSVNPGNLVAILAGKI